MPDLYGGVGWKRRRPDSMRTHILQEVPQYSTSSHEQQLSNVQTANFESRPHFNRPQHESPVTLRRNHASFVGTISHS